MTLHATVPAEVRTFLSKAGRIGGLQRASQCDVVEMTAPARAASPSSDSYWLRQVDPGGVLPEKERARRATAAKKAYFAKLALKSALVRRGLKP